MWTNFVECPDAVRVTSTLSFTLSILNCLKDNKGIAGLLRYLPAGALVRVHLGDDGRLHITAVGAPSDAVLFPLGEPNALNLNGDPWVRTAGEQWEDTGKAVAFFFTEENKAFMARSHTTKLVALDYVRLLDLIDTSKFKMVASFPLEIVGVKG